MSQYSEESLEFDIEIIKCREKICFTKNGFAQVKLGRIEEKVCKQIRILCEAQMRAGWIVEKFLKYIS